MSGTLGNSVARFRDDIVGPLHTLSIELQSGGTEIAEAIARHSVNLGETVESHVRRIGAESTAQLVARIEELRGLVEGPASDLVAKLGARGDEVADQIAGVSAQASQSFDQQIRQPGRAADAARRRPARGDRRQRQRLGARARLAQRPDRRRGRILDRRAARRRRGRARAIG